MSSARLTDQQHRAVSRREVSVILSSGAGCGKTHVLTERYLSHLRDDGIDVSQIVAITFTDRAARQMRDRIRRAVLQELQSATSEEDVERWSRHLRGLETALISTIHAFCGTLLRQNAIEAGLDPQFDVLDEVLSANLQSESLRECLQDLLTANTPLGDDLRTLVLLHGWRPLVAAIEDLTTVHDAPAWDAWLALPAEVVAQRWLEGERRTLLPAYIDYLLAASPKIAGCLALLRSTPCSKPQTAAKVKTILEETPRLAEAPDLTAALAVLLDAAKVANSKERASAWPSEEIYASVKSAFENFRKELETRLELFVETPEGLTEVVTVGQRFLRVAKEAAHAYQRRKRRASILDFQDLLFMARDLLRNNLTVREGLQRRYRFLLVDELQDTDPVQMEIVEALCGGGLTTGKLFGVGDFKQSIYRFRGADVSLFQRLRRSVPHEGRLGLSLNFRSQPAILHFVNTLFRRRIADYELLQAHHPQRNPGPCVEFLWTPRMEKESAGESRQREADNLARRLTALIAGEPLVVDHASSTLRPVRPGDIVLLFRSMSHVALYESALRRYGLDYYLVGGRAFFAQQEIYDILNLLRTLENPQDEVSLAGTLRSPFCCVSDEALVLCGRFREGLWAGLLDDGVFHTLPESQRPLVQRARLLLEKWRTLKDRLPIARLLGQVMADSGYDAALQFEFLGDRKLANLWKMLDLARSFDRSGLFGLAEFIGRLGDLVARQPREEQAATQPESADVVRLMTIHQAKGLEFPVVVIPDLAARTGGNATPVALWDDRLGCVARPPGDEDPPPFTDFALRLWRTREAVEEWAEDLRTLYVACTRAQDYLILSASLGKGLAPETPWMLALSERFDLAQGNCLAEEISGEEAPPIRVFDLDKFPLPPPEHPQGLENAARVRAPLLGLGEAGVAPILPRKSEKSFFTVVEIEKRLSRNRGRAHDDAVDIAESASEDGSDATNWHLPGEPREHDSALRLCRDVLRVADPHHPENWPRRLLGANLLDPCTPSEFEKAKDMMTRFATSQTYAILNEASKLASQVAFYANLSTPGQLLVETTPVVVTGILDFVAEQPEGAMHLVAFAPIPRRGVARCPLTLILGGHSLNTQSGHPPHAVTWHDLTTGQFRTLLWDELDSDKILNAVRQALSSERGE